MPVVVWGTGNMGRAAIRSVVAHPGLELAAVVVSSPEKEGRDAGDLADLGRRLGVAATLDADAALADLGGGGAVAYTASGELRPDEAMKDIATALRGGAVVVTPAVYALYDHRNAPDDVRAPLEEACREGGSALFVSGIDPGWGNDLLPVLVSGFAGTVDAGALPGDLRLLDVRRGRLGADDRRHGRADGLRAADGRARHPDAWCGAGRCG